MAPLFSFRTTLISFGITSLLIDSICAVLHFVASLLLGVALKEHALIYFDIHSVKEKQTL